MSACRFAIVLCTASLSASVVSAADPDPDLEDPGVVTASRRPPLHPRLSERVAAKLEGAIPVARDRIREYSSCEELFTRLGADGVTTLDGASYHPAGPRQESKYCRDGSFAVTTVGGSAVVLCRSFARLSDHQAAIILIHEALHLAGQSEYPVDADAPDTLRITEMVMEGCRLF